MKITWVTIKVKNFEESKSFYKDFLGLKLETEFSPMAGMTIAFLKDENGVEIELIYNKNIKVETKDSTISIGIALNNFDEIYEKAKLNERKVSGKVTMPTGMECFFVQDPNGVEIQVIREESLK